MRFPYRQKASHVRIKRNSLSLRGLPDMRNDSKGRIALFQQDLVETLTVILATLNLLQLSEMFSEQRVSRKEDQAILNLLMKTATKLLERFELNDFTLTYLSQAELESDLIRLLQSDLRSPLGDIFGAAKFLKEQSSSLENISDQTIHWTDQLAYSTDHLLFILDSLV
jgi:K+-sensing histidine kinase KdpD